MLGARLQRTPVLYLQQPATAPAREVWRSSQVDVPQLRRRVHADNRKEWAHGTREVQATTGNIT